MNPHPFFEEIKDYPDFVPGCNPEITELPEPYIGTQEIKAILLGADPTNNKNKKQTATNAGVLN